MSYDYERVPTPASGLRLHLNENTAGCSPAVIDALRRLTRHDAAFYPDYAEAETACASRHGVTRDRMILTNGLDEGILALSVAALRNSPAASPFEAIVVVPAFDMYAACADAAGGRVVAVPVAPDFSFPFDHVRAAISERTRLVWVTNPNNPTGQIVARQQIAAVARAAPQAIVAVDEAYADFSGETLLGDPVFQSLRNIVVGRTFAKAYGLAGLRAGALFGDPETLAQARRTIPPYSLNAYAAAALPAAFADTAYYEWYLDQVSQSKALLYQTFDRPGVTRWTSAANFVLARFAHGAGSLVQRLAARGIYVRDRSTDAACPGCVRFTAGVLADTRVLAAALEEVLCGAV